MTMHVCETFALADGTTIIVGQVGNQPADVPLGTVSVSIQGTVVGTITLSARRMPGRTRRAVVETQDPIAWTKDQESAGAVVLIWK